MHGETSSVLPKTPSIWRNHVANRSIVTRKRENTQEERNKNTESLKRLLSYDLHRGEMAGYLGGEVQELMEYVGEISTVLHQIASIGKSFDANRSIGWER